MGQSQSAPFRSCCNGCATVRTRLDRHTFAAGETVTGTLYLHIAQPVSLKHVSVKVKREEQGSSRALADVSGSSHASPDTDWGLVTVECESTILQQQPVAAGTYAYPISLTLPVDAPSSFFVKREASERNVSLLYWFEAEATMDNSSTDATICDETLLTVLCPKQPHQQPPSDVKLLPDQQQQPQQPPADLKLLPEQRPRQQQQQRQLQQEMEEEAGVCALVQSPLPHPTGSCSTPGKQAVLCGSGIAVVPGSCFRSRGAVSVEVYGPSAVLRAGQPLAVAMQVKNQSTAPISKLLVELHQCGAMAEGYVPVSPKADHRKGEVTRRLASADPLPGLAAWECRLGAHTLKVEVPVGRRVQGCVSGKAVRMYYALVIKAVAAGSTQPLELLRVPLDAEDGVYTGDAAKKAA